MILNKVVTHKYKAFSSNVLKNLCISKNMKRLPILKKQFTVLRSPHIDKKSREQFELRTHAWTNTHVVTHEDKQIESLVGIGHQKKIVITILHGLCSNKREILAGFEVAFRRTHM